MKTIAEKIFFYMCHLKKSESTLIKNLQSQENAYMLHDNKRKANESNFTYNINPLWGDL